MRSRKREIGWRKGGESSEDSDDIYDEIDRHHMKRYEADQPKKKPSKTEEVLNVEGNLSSDDDDVASNEFDSDEQSDEDNIEKKFPSSERWGNKRKDFYSTSYIDQDWGGMNENEMEVAELEEQDATMRQKKLDTALGSIQYFFDDYDDEEKKSPAELVDIDALDDGQLFEHFLELNPGFAIIIDEYTRVRKILIEKMLPLLNGAKKLRIQKRTALQDQIHLAIRVFAGYLLNILFYCHLKMSTKLTSGSESYIDNHPVLESILHQRQMVADVEEFLNNNKKRLAELQLLIESNEPFVSVFKESGTIRIGRENSSEIRETGKTSKTSMEAIEDGICESIHDDKRRITSQIQNNRGLTSYRKKGTRHSRVKKRKQFKKAMIKKRSRKPDVRKFEGPYHGEPRGIRAFTIKSTKLKA